MFCSIKLRSLNVMFPFLCACVSKCSLSDFINRLDNFGVFVSMSKCDPAAMCNEAPL